MKFSRLMNEKYCQTADGAIQYWYKNGIEYTKLAHESRCNMEFLMYPTTVKMLAGEINAVCDAYLARKIGLDEFKKVIHHYAGTFPEMLFNADEYNPTILNRIGKKRVKLLDKILEGYQYGF